MTKRKKIKRSFFTSEDLKELKKKIRTVKRRRAKFYRRFGKEVKTK